MMSTWHHGKLSAAGIMWHTEYSNTNTTSWNVNHQQHCQATEDAATNKWALFPLEDAPQMVWNGPQMVWRNPQRTHWTPSSCWGMRKTCPILGCWNWGSLGWHRSLPCPSRHLRSGFHKCGSFERSFCRTESRSWTSSIFGWDVWMLLLHVLNQGCAIVGYWKEDVTETDIGQCHLSAGNATEVPHDIKHQGSRFIHCGTFCRPWQRYMHCWMLFGCTHEHVVVPGCFQMQRKWISMTNCYFIKTKIKDQFIGWNGRYSRWSE